jgi:L-amino acid N-acyltransferase YncA
VFLDKLSSLMTHAPPGFVRCGKWRRVGDMAGSPLRCASLERLRDGLARLLEG